MLSIRIIAQENLAFQKPAISSGANWGAFKPAALTDGDPYTFTHPLGAAGTLGFFYQVDLGRSFRFDRIVLHNRRDGCCPERLSKVRVEIYADGGDVPAGLNWSTNLRLDGSNSGIGGTDTITEANSPEGTFSGRFVRIVNTSNAAYNPQIAEIEVYGGAPPAIRSFGADEDVIAAGQGTNLRWEISDATSATIGPDIGDVSAPNGFVVVQPRSTTTYTLTARNENGSAAATATVGVDVALAPPDLTEFLADNTESLGDEDGDASDWIELRNPNAFGLDVGGYFLTDDPANLKKWPLPAVRIPANGFLVVFASAKDWRDPRAELHTNFKLDADGDFLALVARDGTTILRQFPADLRIAKTFAKQRENVSYGIDAQENIGFFRPPTPGAINATSFAGVVEETKLSRDRGFHDTSITVEITTKTPGATIRYTTGGAVPTARNGMIYSTPLVISKTTVLRAAAFKEGWAPTSVDTRTFVFPNDVISSAVMRPGITTDPVYGPQMRAALLDLPSVSLVSAATINDTSDVPMSVEWLRPDGERGFQADCGVRLFGGAFTEFAKKSFRLYFRSEFGAAKLKYPIFAGFEHGLAAVNEFDQLELRSGSHDMEMRGFYMSNVFADDTLLEMGQFSPHGRFVHVYLNGAYWGVYHLRERWGAAMHQSYLGGSRNDYESINGNWNVGGWPDPGTAYDGDGSTWARVKSLRNDYQAVKAWLDVPNYIDFMLTWMYGRCEDEYRCVGPTVVGSGFKFYVNDADGFFQSPANPWYGEPSNRTVHSAPGRRPGDGPGSLFSTLLAEGDPDYQTLLADRIYQAFFNNGALTPERNAARLAQRCAEIERPFLAEAARWNYRTPSNWAAIRDDIFNHWLPTRSGAVLSQLRSAGFYQFLEAPVLDQQGGQVTNGFLVGMTGPPNAT
ncbi:MAG: CotH kinase family protein, partial [Verrucomicrobiales bacterium]|nr:CotH kinase family protein [Verrucomicrobiales bacterium]